RSRIVSPFKDHHLHRRCHVRDSSPTAHAKPCLAGSPQAGTSRPRTRADAAHTSRTGPGLIRLSRMDSGIHPTASALAPWPRWGKLKAWGLVRQDLRTTAERGIAALQEWYGADPYALKTGLYSRRRPPLKVDTRARKGISLIPGSLMNTLSALPAERLSRQVM